MDPHASRVLGAVPSDQLGLINVGLAIVARLLQVMHGSIAIESASGAGTRVNVRLPSA
jgi:signal transduction histidine kinase